MNIQQQWFKIALLLGLLLFTYVIYQAFVVTPKYEVEQMAKIEKMKIEDRIERDKVTKQYQDKLEQVEQEERVKEEREKTEKERIEKECIVLAQQEKREMKNSMDELWLTCDSDPAYEKVDCEKWKDYSKIENEYKQREENCKMGIENTY